MSRLAVFISFSGEGGVERMVLNLIEGFAARQGRDADGEERHPFAEEAAAGEEEEGREDRPVQRGRRPDPALGLGPGEVLVQERVAEAAAPTEAKDIMEPTHWVSRGWRAKVIKNEDDEGWAVEMYRVGDAEPALVGPWTMGRDKKNPKPLDVSAFNTLVKTANEVIRRHEQQLHAQLNKNVTITTAQGQRLRVALAIVPDEEGATATLRATDEYGEELACVPVPPTFRREASST